MKSHDSKCYELAAYFLEDCHPALRNERNRLILAQAIQDAVEDTIHDLNEELRQ